MYFRLDMQQKNIKLQKRYEGFLQTPFLWLETPIMGLQQLLISPKFTKITIEIDENLRLGKYVERFVSFELQQQDTFEILSENIQIQQDKRTLGELDCLLAIDKQPIHLEIVYKFYLYDTTVGTTEIEHFIGPNRKDSLIEKLTKLSEKQLPLLFHKETLSTLENLNLELKKIQQKVYFKAQLFLPYQQPKTIFKEFNSNCVAGFYCHFNELSSFKNCKFFIPQKKDWLIIPYQQIAWITFSDFSDCISIYMQQKYAPLCWIKFKNGEMKKFFVIWWKTF